MTAVSTITSVRSTGPFWHIYTDDLEQTLKEGLG